MFLSPLVYAISYLSALFAVIWHVLNSLTHFSSLFLVVSVFSHRFTLSSLSALSWSADARPCWGVSCKSVCYGALPLTHAISALLSVLSFFHERRVKKSPLCFHHQLRAASMWQLTGVPSAPRHTIWGYVLPPKDQFIAQDWQSSVSHVKEMVAPLRFNLLEECFWIAVPIGPSI